MNIFVFQFTLGMILSTAYGQLCKNSGDCYEGECCVTFYLFSSNVGICRPLATEGSPCGTFLKVGGDEHYAAFMNRCPCMEGLQCVAYSEAFLTSSKILLNPICVNMNKQDSGITYVNDYERSQGSSNYEVSYWPSRNEGNHYSEHGNDGDSRDENFLNIEDLKSNEFPGQDDDNGFHGQDHNTEEVEFPGGHGTKDRGEGYVIKDAEFPGINIFNFNINGESTGGDHDTRDTQFPGMGHGTENSEFPEMSYGFGNAELAEMGYENADAEFPRMDHDTGNSEFPGIYPETEEVEFPRIDPETEEVEFPGMGHETEEVEFPGIDPETEEVEFPGMGPETEEVEFPGIDPETEEVEFPGMGHETGDAELPGMDQETGDAEFPGMDQKTVEITEVENEIVLVEIPVSDNNISDHESTKEEDSEGVHLTTVTHGTVAATSTTASNYTKEDDGVTKNYETGEVDSTIFDDDDYGDEYPEEDDEHYYDNIDYQENSENSTESSQANVNTTTRIYTDDYDMTTPMTTI